MTINPKTEEAYQLFHNGILALCRAEQQGIRVDIDYIKNKKEQLTRKIDRLETTFQDSKFYRHWEHSKKGKVNIYSNQQLSHFLYNVKKIAPPKETVSGQGATDEDALKSLDIPELNNLLKIRKLKKIRDTYLDAFLREQVDGYIHPFFNLHLVRTYRSCVAEGTPILVTRDFISNPKGIPIEQVKAGDYVYCFDNNLKPSIQKVLWAGKTGHREVIRIHYSVKGGGGKGYLDVTPEHKIRLIDGSYVEAKNLTGDFRTEKESKHLPKIRVLSCKRVADQLRFTGHLINGNGLFEHRMIYEKFIGPLTKEDVIHHKNGNHLDHSITNLKKLILETHSRYHSKRVSEEIKQIRIKALNDNRWKIKYKTGFENKNSLALSKYTCYKLLCIAGGNIVKVPHDYESFKKYLKFYGIDYFQVKLRFDRNGTYIWRKQLQKLSKLGRATVSSILGINYYKLLKLYKLYNLPIERQWANQFGEFKPGNHIITKIEKIKKIVDVYDLEIENFHNFIANEICVHNSSDSPNFQNIPKRDEEAMLIVRKALYPRPGYQLLEVDFSGLEVRIAACYHKDSTMLKYIKDPTTDMHRDMAIQIFKLDDFVKGTHDVLRQAAKNGFVFPEFYGDYYVNCASNMACGWLKLPNGTWSAGQGIQINGVYASDHMISKGLSSLSKFEKHVKTIEDDFWFNRFKEYAEWKERWYKVYKKYGYIDLLTGFRCSGVMSKNEVINTPVQGAAFHCLLWSFIEMDRLLIEQKLDTKLIGQIHDSMILDVNPAELDTIVALVRRVTCIDLPKAWTWINVSLDVEIEMCAVDDSWAEKTKMKFDK